MHGSPHHEHPGFGTLTLFLGITCALLLLLFAAGGGMYLYYAHDLPEFTSLTDYRPPKVTTVLTRDGRVLGRFCHELRYPVALAHLPSHLIKAFLAMEDESFYEHEGIDFQAIIRAFLVNTMEGDTIQGGSTITQQVVKQLLLTSERTLERKIREAILAYRLERNLSKDEILSIYLNQVFFGAGAYGVEAAARVYFNKHAVELNLAEAALLAALPKAPANYNPFRAPEAAKARQELVLGRMLQLGWITEQEYEQAWARELHYLSEPDPSWRFGAWYLEEVRRELIREFSEENLADADWNDGRFGEDALYELGLTVITCMDSQHQLAAETAMSQGLEEFSAADGYTGPLDGLGSEDLAAYLADGPGAIPGHFRRGLRLALVLERHEGGVLVDLGAGQGLISRESLELYSPSPDLQEGDVVLVSCMARNDQGLSLCRLRQEPAVQGALISMEPDSGDVVALVGGYDFGASQFNRATQAVRQPGSAFKPIVFSAALDQGFTPASVISDSPLNIYGWRPKNYDGSFAGPMTLRTALIRSRNVVAVRLAREVGIDAVIQRARDLGVTSPIPRVLPICLGSSGLTPLELTQAYSAFARDGSIVRPRFVSRILDHQGRVIRDNLVESQAAVSQENAHAMAMLLRQVVEYGTGRRARELGRPVAGKTGTSNDERDAWFVGFTPWLLTTVWVGRDDFTPMSRGRTGGRTALPIWLAYRLQVEERYPDGDFQPPAGIAYVMADGQRMPSVSAVPVRILPPVPEDGTEARPDAWRIEEPVLEEILKQMY